MVLHFSSSRLHYTRGYFLDVNSSRQSMLLGLRSVTFHVVFLETLRVTGILYSFSEKKKEVVLTPKLPRCSTFRSRTDSSICQFGANRNL